jgi:hypothetical protein
MVAFEIAVGLYLWMVGLVEMQGEYIGVGENIFLINRECYILRLL